MEMFIPAGHVYQWIVKKISPFANHRSLNSIVAMPQKTNIAVHQSLWKRNGGMQNVQMYECLLNEFYISITTTMTWIGLPKFWTFSCQKTGSAESVESASDDISNLEHPLFGRQSCPHVHPSWTTSSAWSDFTYQSINSSSKHAFYFSTPEKCIFTVAKKNNELQQAIQKLRQHFWTIRLSPPGYCLYAPGMSTIRHNNLQKETHHASVLPRPSIFALASRAHPGWLV